MTESHKFWVDQASRVKTGSRRVDVNVLRPMWKKLDVAPILAQRTSQVEHNYPCMADMAYEWLMNGL